MNRKKIMTLLSMVVFLCTTLTAQDHKYIGATKCKMCHNKAAKGEQYNKWKEGPHANAMSKLEGDEAKDPKCLKCHSTAGAVDAGLIATLKVEEGVSCESCHGPGSIYKNKTIMMSREKSMEAGLILPEEKVCLTCHNDESPDFKGFNFAEYSAKMAHPDPTVAK